MSFEQERSGYPPTNNSNPLPPRPIDTRAGNGLRGPNTGESGGDNDVGADISRRLDIALNSDQGVEKLQNRLRQSIYSARDFASLLKERCALEDRYAQGFKKLVRTAADTIRRSEARQGSFFNSLDETLRINDRLADNSSSFASELHTMSEELRDMAETSDKGRKHWKHTSADAERRVMDAENAQHKAKDRYNTAAEQYDRLKTGGERPGGMFGLKNKSPQQQEEALKEKADMLGQEYNTKSESARTQRYEYESSLRPSIVQALRDLIDECDAHLAMQMAKLASISEKHVVSNGMAISPIQGSTNASAPEPRSLRLIAQAIDNRKDFNDYILDGTENTRPFNPRSPRSTLPEQVHSPVQPAQSSGVTYNNPQNNVDSAAPQLPRIGGPDGFSSSFEGQRSGPADRTSYSGGQQFNNIQSPTNQSQQSPFAPDMRPPLGSNPSLPAFDRAQPATNGAITAPPFSRAPSALPMPGAFPRNDGRSQPPAHNTPVSYTGRGDGAPPYEASRLNNDQGLGRGQSPISSGQQPGFGRNQSASYADRAQGLPSVAEYGRGQPPLDSNNRPGLGRDQYSSFSNPVLGPAAPPTGPGLGRGQSPTNYGPSPGFGRGQPSPYNDRSQDLTAASPIGRGQPAGRGGLPSQQPAQPSRPTLPPLKPVFGMHLDELLRRDGTAVPAIVFQCIESVDMHGMTVEGIYRVSGSSPTVMQLKSEFDHGKSSYVYSFAYLT